MDDSRRGFIKALMAPPVGRGRAVVERANRMKFYTLQLKLKCVGGEVVSDLGYATTDEEAAQQKSRERASVIASIVTGKLSVAGDLDGTDMRKVFALLGVAAADVVVTAHETEDDTIVRAPANLIQLPGGHT